MSIQLHRLIADRDETPRLVGAGDNGCEVYAFADGTEVIVTNGDLVTEDADGFAELRVATVGG